MSPELSSVNIVRADISDSPLILEMERTLFQEPWSLPMIQEEILNENGDFLCVKDGAGILLGYGGFYVVGGDEGHLTNLAIHPIYRRCGLAIKLMIELIKMGETRGVKRFTLEVRRSNIPAIQLYKKFGFFQEGIRKNYYPVSGEDALILWTPDVTTDDYDLLLRNIINDLNTRQNNNDES